MNKPLALVAIGGNSLIKSGHLQRVEDQHRAVRETMRHVADLIEGGWRVVISHGNGPQVGFSLRRSEVARRRIGMPPVPLVSVVAETQGAIGWQIQQSLDNELRLRGVKGQCVTVITQVVVDPADPAFEAPSKPVGEFFDESQLAVIGRECPHWRMLQDAGRGYRRVVPSPRPLEVVERPVVAALLEAGYHVVAVGGGGIPVVKKGEAFEGVDAVIDKDLASSLLAGQLGAEMMIISTAVERVALFFGTPRERPIGTLTAAEAAAYMKEGHFAPGSMLPKVEAALSFLKAGGKGVIITAPAFIRSAVRDGAGTHIVP